MRSCSVSKVKTYFKTNTNTHFQFTIFPQHLNFEIQILLIFYQKEAIKNQNDTVKMKGYSVSNPCNCKLTYNKFKILAGNTLKMCNSVGFEMSSPASSSQGGVGKMNY